jgi:hypothetical protein
MENPSFDSRQEKQALRLALPPTQRESGVPSAVAQPSNRTHSVLQLRQTGAARSLPLDVFFMARTATILPLPSVGVLVVIMALNCDSRQRRSVARQSGGPGHSTRTPTLRAECVVNKLNWQWHAVLRVRLFYASEAPPSPPPRANQAFLLINHRQYATFPPLPTQLGRNL